VATLLQRLLFQSVSNKMSNFLDMQPDPEIARKQRMQQIAKKNRLQQMKQQQ